MMVSERAQEREKEQERERERERSEWNGKAVRLAVRERWERPGTRQGKRFSCCWFGEPRVGVPSEQPRSRWPCLHRERRHESAPVDRVHLTSDAYFSPLRLPCPSASAFVARIRLADLLLLAVTRVPFAQHARVSRCRDLPEFRCQFVFRTLVEDLLDFGYS